MRPIDAKPGEKIFKRWLDDIPDGEETPAIEQCLNVVKNAPTLTPPNEPLTCEGCVYEPDCPSSVHCQGCARMYTDHYRRAKDE